MHAPYLLLFASLKITLISIIEVKLMVLVLIEFYTMLEKKEDN